MTIYEIDQRITELVDPDTGELLDLEAFTALAMERERKIEGMALWVKELTALASDIKDEISVLQERKKAAEGKAERLKGYLAEILDYKKTVRPTYEVTFRRSSKCVPAEGFIEWAQTHRRDDLLSYKPPAVSLTAVKEALRAGEDVPAEMVETISVGVK